MSFQVDLNCDMGESFGAYSIGNDEEVIHHITSANIACGFHASDPAVMEKTVGLCRENGVRVGAHPGYPDLIGFGRRFLDMDYPELMSALVYQVGALTGFTRLLGEELQHVKLHGALYNFMVREEERFVEIAGRLKKAFGDIIFVTLGTGRSAELKNACRKIGLRIALEAFPDRMYTDEGELMPRKEKEAVLKDPDRIARRAVDMVVNRGVESAGGRWISMDIDTLCIHGDNRQSIVAAGMIRDLAAKEGVAIRPVSEFV